MTLQEQTKPCTNVTSWTDWRIEQLRRLAAEGASHRAMAKELGLSRGAVIGKIHRMGLSYQPAPFWTDEVVAKLRALWMRGDLTRAQIAEELKTSEHAIKAKARQLKLPTRVPGPISEARRAPKPINANAADVTIPFRQRRSLFQLKSHHCRWVVGDVPNYFFCGADKQPGRPYCVRHCKRAYA